MAYVLAAAAAVLAALARWALVGAFGDMPLFITFYPAVALAAMLLGSRATVLTTVLSAVAADYFFIPPRGFGIGGLNHAIALGLFITTGLLISLLSGFLDRARLRQSASEQESLLRAMSEGIPDPLFLKDKDSRIIIANAATLRAVGKPADQIIGHTDTEFYDDPAVAQAIMANDRRVMESGQPEVMEEFVPGADRGRTYLSIKTPWRDASGRIIGVIGCARDITDRKRAEEALRESEQRLRASFDNAALGILETDSRSHFIAANDRACQILGYPREELLGMTTLELTFSEDRPASKEMIAKLHEGLIDTFDIQNRYIRRDGSAMWGHTTVSAIRDSAGRFARAIATIEDITERKGAQQERDRAVERTRAILESISDAFFSLDNDLAVTYFNQAAERVLGRKSADVLGRYLFDAFPEARGSVFDEKYHQAIKDKSFLSFETFFEVEPFRNWYDVRVYPQAEGISVYFQVITERKRAEEALRESEAKFRTLHEMSPIAIVLNRLDSGQFLESNQALWDMTGYTEEEFRSLTYWDITPIEYADMEAKQLELLQTVGRYGPYEKEYIRKDGTRVPVLLSGVRLVARDGVECICSTVQDITELKDREMALRESESRFRTLFEEEMDGIMLADMDTQQLAMPNPQICRMLGYTAEEIRALKVSDIHPAEDLPRIREGFAKQSRGEISMTPELPVLRRDGSLFYADVIAKPVELGERRWLLGIFRDVTERKRAADQLRELNATLEQRVAERTAEAQHRAAQLQRLAAQLTEVEQRERQQLATLLHDHLQQLLVAAKFRLTTVRSQPLQEKYLQALRQANELIDSSLKTSRSLTAELSPPILHEGTLAQVMQWLARSAKDKYGLTVLVSADEEAELRVPEVRFLIFQAVRELLMNVAKHAGVDRASLSLRRTAPDRVQIVVADEGVGFDSTRKAAETAQGQAGVGLGLFSIRERLELMGGSLEIDSRPGEGTRISLTAACPLLVAAGPAEAPVGEMAIAGRAAGPAVEARPQDQANIRILLADDHEVVRTGLARLLQTEPGIEIAGQAADGQEAMEVALQIQPDVILMDVSMPRMNGVEATRRIVQQMPNVKIIGLSMHEQEDVAASMKAAGAAIYLSKTSPPEALVAAIRECAPRAAAAR